jgi:hypothetical protein
MQPLGTTKNQKGHHLNTPPLWKTSRAQHCQAGRYLWAIIIMALTLDQLVEKYKASTMTDADLKESGYMIHQVEAATANCTENGVGVSIDQVSIVHSSGILPVSPIDGGTF